ncbi:MAG: glutamate--tRNA ligase [Christensenellales bacterium]
MDYEKLAEMLFPNIDKNIEYYLKKYPKRDLKDGALVTRVAPSPTGYLHIGTVYQALLNKTLAEQSGGVFLLRIEDTDEKREVKGAADIMYPCLKDFGVEPMEGYVSCDKQIGEYGPYKQSERKEIYQAFCKDLVRMGKAYPCFCSGDDEDDSCDYRKEQKRLGLQTGYYGEWAKCRNLSLEEVEENLKQHKPFKIRIRADGDGEQRIVFSDELRGKISLPKNFIDYVLLKEDGQAVYHLAHLVDDTLMHTSLVVRDESWLPSVPLHMQLFEFAKLPHPKYLHTAQILTIDQQTGNARKVSKRYDPWADSRKFLEAGIPSEAIREYLMILLNSNFETFRLNNPLSDMKDYQFKISNMNKSGAQFDHEKLNFISKNVISRFSAEKVYNDVLAYSKEYDKELYDLICDKKDYAIKMFSIERGTKKPRKDIASFRDIKSLYYYFFNTLFDKKQGYDFEERFKKQDIKTILTRYAESYSENDEKDVWFSKIKTLGEDLGFATDMKEFKENPDKFVGSYADIAGIIRMALTKEKNTPDLFEICKILGKDEIKRRIDLI